MAFSYCSVLMSFCYCDLNTYQYYLREVDLELNWHMVAPFEFLMDGAVDHDLHVFLCHEMIIETPSFVQTTRIHPSVSEETKLLSLGVQVSKRVNEAHI